MTASPRSPSAAAEPPPRTATRNRGESRGHLCLGGRVRGPSQLRLRHPWLLATATGARRARPWNKGSVAPAAWWGCRAPRCRSPVAAARDEDGQPWSRSGRAGPSFCVASTGPTQLPTSIRPTSPASQSHPLTPGPLWQQSGPSGTLTAAGHAAKQATAPEAPEGATGTQGGLDGGLALPICCIHRGHPGTTEGDDAATFRSTDATWARLPCECQPGRDTHRAEAGPDPRADPWVPLEGARHEGWPFKNIWPQKNCKPETEQVPVHPCSQRHSPEQRNRSRYPRAHSVTHRSQRGDVTSPHSWRDCFHKPSAGADSGIRLKCEKEEI
ncbi:uncharacterized protein LOC144576739 isoform X1 [Callithrix jacchus]